MQNPKVYFKPIDSYTKTQEISNAAAELLDTIVKNQNIALENAIPLKVHFGEKGNKTYIESKNYHGIIDYLKNQNINTQYIETNVLYRGERTYRDSHIKIAKEHGFTELPIVIADGDHGEEFEFVEINKKNFKKCKIGKEFVKHKQIIVISHFKGHGVAGFGGAIKQLSMGCAARGGKLDQHANAVPIIKSSKCKSCSICVKNCPVSAMTLNPTAQIGENCIGCAACMAICPHGAITHSWSSKTGNFHERLAEYAYAAQLGKNNIYINFAFNITEGCDCMGQAMEPIAKDIGVFASTDPVAIDQACNDILDKTEGRTVFEFGRHALEHGEQIGLGTRDYELVLL